MTLVLLFIAFQWRSICGHGGVFTNHWAVRIKGGQQRADRVALKYGYVNYGQIGSLEDHYHFHHSRVVRRAAFTLKGPHSFIHMDPEVGWAQQQVVKPRIKRNEPSLIHFNDPKWSSMWYIHCSDKSSRCRSEMNILAAWGRGFTGRNVVVTILDDGIERNHPDLIHNYDHLASYDVNGNDHDPTPRYDNRNENIHGTRCAGEVAAEANNSHCTVGVAFNAHIGGIRMLDGDVTDLVEAKSLGVRPDYIDIYSASWGPKDDGKTVDGPGPLTKQAFEQGIKKGRKGLGSIFVWASGNGGRQGDHCSCDGYTSSIYTVSISSTTENGNKPWYLEVCSSIMATTYSSGEFNERKIVTTDLRHRCTDAHTGTSVSAPIVAGIIALALEANLLLTWRDVQHLLVKTSRPVHLKADDWKTNAAGLRGPGNEECIQCAEGYLQQEWMCVQACTPGYYPADAAGVPHRMCHRCEENCVSCSGPGTTCTKCKDGYRLVSKTCIVNASCNNADEAFCEMVKSNRLCEKKLYRQFCCRTCLMNG